MWDGDETIHSTVMSCYDAMGEDAIPLFLHLNSNFQVVRINPSISVDISKYWDKELNDIYNSHDEKMMLLVLRRKLLNILKSNRNIRMIVAPNVEYIVKVER